MQSAKENTNKLPVSVKFCYMIGDFGKNSFIILNMMFLLYFYTDIIQIPAGVAAVIMLIARVWDAVNDPMMGIILDKTKSKEGKCRFYLKYFSVPAGVCLALSYFVPGLNESGKIIWVAITYILQGTVSTIIMIPMNTLMARLTDDKYERVSLGQYKSVASLGANLIIPAMTLPLVNMLGENDLQRGFCIVAVIYGAAYAICHLIVYFGTKGYEKTDDEISESTETKNKTENVTVGQMIKALLQNKVCLLVGVSYIVYLLECAIVGSSLVYYLQYNLKNTNLMSMYSLIGTVIGILPILIIKILVKKFGNAKTAALGCLIVVFGEVLRFITKDQYLPILYFGWGLEGIGMGLFASLLYQCMFDSMVYGEWKTGVLNEGVIMSILSFSQKTGQALGGVVSAALLTLVPYIPNAIQQEQSVLNLFFAENVTLPMVLFFILFGLFMYIYKFEKMIPQMKKEIAERKARQA